MSADRVCMIPVYIEKDLILFHEEDQDLQSDSWRKSGNCEKTQILRNRQNLVLIAQPDGAIFESVTIQEMSSVPGIKFDIHSYQDTDPRGLPVVFTTELEQKTHHMHVAKGSGRMTVHFKEGDAPKSIDGTTSDVIFIKTPFSEGDGQFFMFESTLEQGYFLAFEKNGKNNISRLIVKRKEKMDLVDESFKLNHSPFPQTN